MITDHAAVGSLRIGEVVDPIACSGEAVVAVAFGLSRRGEAFAELVAAPAFGFATLPDGVSLVS